MAENLAFNPLGSVNRARRVINESLSEFRRKAKDVPREEPRSFPDEAGVLSFRLS
jgi:hypothetical protein